MPHGPAPTTQRGAILVTVLAALALLALMGAHAARFANAREREALDAWCREVARADHDDRRAGRPLASHATIGDGAIRALSFEGFHGSQTFSTGLGYRVGHGLDCQRRG